MIQTISKALQHMLAELKQIVIQSHVKHHSDYISET